MRFGTYSSMGLHALFFGWVFITGTAHIPTHDDFEVTQVTLISPAAFRGLQDPDTEGSDETAEDAIEVRRDAPSELPPIEDAPTAPIEELPEPPPIDNLPAIPVEALPEEPEIAAPVFVPEAQDDEAPPTTVIDEGAPKPIERVASIPIEATGPKEEKADELADKRSLEPEQKVIDEPVKEDKVVRESATTQTITEATETGDSLAPSSSSLPQRRPVQLAKRETKEALAKPKKSDERFIALGTNEKNAFRREISQCWNFTALSSEAQRINIVVAFSLDKEARPLRQSIKMVSASGGSARAQKNAFDVARRAIIRCGFNGFSLPREKYEQWKNISILFNPSLMRLR